MIHLYDYIMLALTRRPVTFIWNNASKLAAFIGIISFVGGQVSELNPIIWQSGIMLLVFLIGYEIGHWRGKTLEDIEDNDTKQVRRSTTEVEIEGCIEDNGVCWRGRLYTTRGEWDYVVVSNDPDCSACQTPLEGSGPQVRGFSYYNCPGCGEEYEYSDRSSIKKLFIKHFRKIWESDGEPYSIDRLEMDILHSQNEDISPKRIWQAYEEQADESEVSVCCFFS